MGRVLGNVPLRADEADTLLRLSSATQPATVVSTVHGPALVVTSDGRIGWALRLLAAWRGSPIRVQRDQCEQ